MLIALAALLAQFAVILTHRRVDKVRTRPDPPVLYTVLSLFGIAAGWLSIGRPEITWSTSVLVLLSGLLITAEAADATAKLGAPRWAPNAVCLLCGAASTTWLLARPLPYL
ncbi:hypothetical protein OG215_35575 [Streptomyces globisporus]|uniref:hypothetical protein n=1 Tax=Streptomyces globisporus TaxID=1908 RepID=UPI0038671ED8|nr:hypothetical protein OG215_35575 [Streptomyces globisporus]